jgi:ElaB/YqjD/DUF883 family membrane-anchored ribosome-binding protein
MEQVPTAGGAAGTNVGNLKEATPATPTVGRERLEQGVKDTAQGVAAVATDAADAVKETAGVTADAFKETVDTVKGAAHDAVASVKDAFDVWRHPWLLLGGAAILGFVVGTLTRRNRR